MNLPSQRALDCAVAAARAAGRLMLRHRAAPKKINCNPAMTSSWNWMSAARS